MLMFTNQSTSALLTDLLINVWFNAVVSVTYNECISHIVAETHELGKRAWSVRFVCREILGNVVYHTHDFSN